MSHYDSFYEDTAEYERIMFKKWRDLVKDKGKAAPPDARSVTGLLEQAWFYGVEVPEEMFDFIKILIHSAKSGKYEPNNWLKSEGAINSDKKSQYGSIFRHVSDGYVGVKVDKDSGYDPRLHAACRLLMSYTRDIRGLEE